MEKIIEKILRKYVETLKNRFGNRLISVSVFGSVARGDAKFPESDFDIFIVLEGIEKLSVGKRIDMVADIYFTLKQSTEFIAFKSKYGSPMFQEHVFTPEEIKHHPPIMLDLTTDALILYDRGILKKEIEKLKNRLNELGSQKRVLPDGRWYWVLKPDLKWGEVVEI